MRRIGLLSAFAACGCGVGGAPGPILKQAVEANPWAAVSGAPTGPPAYRGNSHFGIRLGHDGLGLAPSGQALPCFVLWNNALLRVPNLAAAELAAGGRSLCAGEAFAYESRLDFRTGLWTVRWRQAASGGRTVEARVETAVDPERPLIAQRILLRAGRKVSFSLWSGVRTFLSGPPQGPHEKFDLAVQPSLVSERELASGPGSAVLRITHRTRGKWNGAWRALGSGFRYDGILDAEPIILERVAWLVLPEERSGSNGDAKESMPGDSLSLWERVGVRGMSVPAGFSSLPTFEEVQQRSVEALARKWETDIEIEGPVADQQAIRSFLFYLYTSGNAKLPPMALSSEKYKGHRFWDAEAWTLPVYALVDPQVARAATRWRLDASRPYARIPWETGAEGTDLTPAEFKKALHVAGWVCWWLERAKALGLTSQNAASRLQHATATDFYNAAVRRKGVAEILSVIGPDEGRKRDNDLVTNLLAKYAAQLTAGLPEAPLPLEGGGQGGGDSPRVARSAHARSPSRTELRTFADEVAIPQSEDGLPATYDNDALMTYQQTAALLALYPLEWPFETLVEQRHNSLNTLRVEGIKQRLFDRYKDKVSETGPAMSDSIHAVIAARLGRPEEAYELWQKAWRPFLRPEYMLFSERRGTDDAYFATGAAGCLQSIIFGFLGLRVEKATGGEPEASKPLLNGYRLVVRPQLPRAWRSITFHNVHILGEAYTIRAADSGASISERGE